MKPLIFGFITFKALEWMIWDFHHDLNLFPKLLNPFIKTLCVEAGRPVFPHRSILSLHSHATLHQKVSPTTPTKDL